MCGFFNLKNAISDKAENIVHFITCYLIVSYFVNKKLKQIYDLNLNPLKKTSRHFPGAMHTSQLNLTRYTIVILNNFYL